MRHTESINKKKKESFEVFQQSDFFDVVVGLYTGGPPQYQQRGSAEFRTECFALWCVTLHRDTRLKSTGLNAHLCAERWDNTREMTQNSDESSSQLPSDQFTPGNIIVLGYS